MTTIYLVQNDTGSQIKVNLTREDTGSAVDLSGATVRLKFKKKNTANVLSTLTAAAGSDLSNGEAIFVFAAADTDITAGDYIGEIEVTFSDDSIESVFETIDIVVREDF
jgi:hypothetical protein